MNLLQQFCKSQNWQGGTIWQVIEEATKNGDRGSKFYELGKLTGKALLDVSIPPDAMESKQNACDYIAGVLAGTLQRE